MDEKQIDSKEVTKLEVRMARLAVALNVEAREQKELYEQILRLENRLKNVLGPIQTQCAEKNKDSGPDNAKHAPCDDSPLIASLDDFGRTIVSNTLEINRIQDRLSEIFKRLEI